MVSICIIKHVACLQIFLLNSLVQHNIYCCIHDKGINLLFFLFIIKYLKIHKKVE